MTEQLLPNYALLLAGGSGTRLWPVSRELYPKQLARFFGNASLIQNTVQRLFPIFEPEDIRIICGKEHAHEIGRDVSGIGIPIEGRICTEPCGRNTAPAILMGLFEIMKSAEDAIAFVFPADHVIRDVEDFHRKIESAISLAHKGYIVTFGITPEYPETGYGYIEAGESPVEDGWAIRRFVEKPDEKTAAQYLSAGNFYWNSGMFAFKVSVMADEFKRHKPKMWSMMEEMLSKGEPAADAYQKLENISIDYAIMENTDKGVVLPSAFGWSDIGSWKSLYDFLPKDDQNNAVASGDVIFQKSRNVFVMGSDRLIAVNRLENIAVVETPDSVFVSDMETSRDVKEIVSLLKERGRPEYRVHTTAYEPWGYAKTLEDLEGVMVKRIVVYPEAKIPETTADANLQWLVVQGSASVICGDETKSVRSPGFTHISSGTRCGIENIGEGELQIIEIRGIREGLLP